MAVIGIDSAGNVQQPLRFVYGLDAVRVRLLVRLRMVLGEWLTDGSRGLPAAWIEGGWSGRGPTPTALASTLRLQLASVKGVLEVVRCTVTQDGPRGLRAEVVVRGSEDDETGLLDLSATFDPFATTPAPAWYIVRGIVPGVR